MSGRSWVLLIFGLITLIVVSSLNWSNWFLILPILILIGFCVSFVDDVFFSKK